MKTFEKFKKKNKKKTEKYKKNVIMKKYSEAWWTKWRKKKKNEEIWFQTQYLWRFSGFAVVVTFSLQIFDDFFDFFGMLLSEENQQPI